MSFFEKFEPGSGSGSKTHDPDLASIVENLNSVLNTRKGYGSFLPDFGMSDLNEYSARNDIASAVMREVRHNIELYEPRVQLIDVSMTPDKSPLRLSFTIECSIRENARSLNLVFDTMFSNFHVTNPAG